MWYVKDASKREDLIKQSKEPDVIKAVLDQLDGIGEGVGGIKESYEKLQKDHGFLKELVDRHKDQFEKLPADVQEHITKYTEAVSTRQDALDDLVKGMTDKMAETEVGLVKTIDDRLDAIDVATQERIRKLSISPGGDPDKEREDLKMFTVHRLSLASKDEKGVDFQLLQKLMEDENSLEEFRAYQKAFEAFVRRPQDQSQRSLITPEEAKSLSVGTDPDGGYTVTPAMAARIITRQYEIDPMRELAAVESITTGAIEWMVDWEQAGFGWEGETETGPETTTPGLKKVRIPVHVLFAKPRATQTLLEDSGINIEAWLAGHVARRFGRGEAAAFVSGDGIGKPRGFLTYNDYVTAGGASEWARIEQVAMGHASTLVADGFNRIKYSLVEYYLNRGTWLMNRTAVAEAMRLKDGDGQYIWRPGLEPNAPSVLLGLPVRMSTTMPSVAANALSVALADWQEAYMIVDRLGITIQRDPFTAKPFVEFYTRKRVGGDVVNFEAIKLGQVAV